MKKYERYLIVCALIVGMLTGCGAAEKAGMTAASADTMAMDDAVEEIAVEEAEMEELGAAQVNGYGQDAGTPGASPTENGETQEMEAQQGRKLIRNVYMEAETLEFDAFLQDLRDRVEQIGGYVESSSVSGNGYNYNRYRDAGMTLRIPSEKLDSFISGISALCNITYKNEDVEDITLRYVDVESKKKALETEQERLLSLLEKAETVEDIITIETRLSDVRYELESYGSQLRTYDNQVDYSTVHMQIQEVERVTPAAEETVWDRIYNGFGESIYDILRDMKDFVISFIIHLPYIIEWAVIVFLLYKLSKIIYYKVRVTEKKEKRHFFRNAAKKRDKAEEEYKE